MAHVEQVDATLDVAPSDPSGSRVATVKLATGTWELNIRAELGDLAALAGIRGAEWHARRSLAVGAAAGAAVFWAAAHEHASILVGHDDETWDFAVMVPLSTVDEIVSMAAAANG
jgi:hypothetical protein